ncbi:MAG TPA: hypothetical protein DCS91_08820 [Microcoleaceae bacterium UBA11344]|nr:hypothetical protein [Microcoleaceae cyanobacterium UBA11344]
MLWTPGQILKTRPYRIDTILAQGGFGLTYKATHLQLNHQVVLKTPNVGLQNDPEYANFVRRFIREGQILAKFCQNAHPGIVRVSDLFEEKGIHCLVGDRVGWLRRSYYEDKWLGDSDLTYNLQAPVDPLPWLWSNVVFCGRDWGVSSLASRTVRCNL